MVCATNNHLITGQGVRGDMVNSPVLVFNEDPARPDPIAHDVGALVRLDEQVIFNSDVVQFSDGRNVIVSEQQPLHQSWADDGILNQEVRLHATAVDLNPVLMGTGIVEGNVCALGGIGTGIVQPGVNQREMIDGAAGLEAILPVVVDVHLVEDKIRANRVHTGPVRAAAANRTIIEDFSVAQRNVRRSGILDAVAAVSIHLNAVPFRAINDDVGTAAKVDAVFGNA